MQQATNPVPTVSQAQVRKHIPFLCIPVQAGSHRMAKATSRTKRTFPISSLPSKLLLLIFQALVDDMYCDDDDELRLDCFTLASVCRMWRSLVLSTPRFWTRLHMVVRSRALSCDRLKAIVERSTNALLDVVIYIPRPPSPFSYSGRIWIHTTFLPRIRACLKVLQDCSYRWKSLRVEVVRHELDYMATNFFNLVLLKLCLAHAPALHEVEIICPSSLRWVTSVEKPFQLLSPSHSPLLKKLTLEGCDLKILPPHVDLSCLTHLSLDFIMEYNDVQNSHLAFRNILSSARNIVSLELHRRVFRVGHAETSGELGSIVLATLRTLSIFMNAEEPAYLGSILRTIAAPNLLHFALHNDSLVRGESSLLDFSSFLSQDKMPMFPSVRKLTMKNVLQSTGGPGKNIRCIFTAFPLVTDVVLDNDVREIADYLA